MTVKKSASDAAAAATREPQRQIEMDHVAAALRGLQYGVVSVIVQDGVVIQIERTEKTRLRGKQTWFRGHNDDIKRR